MVLDTLHQILTKHFHLICIPNLFSLLDVLLKNDLHFFFLVSVQYPYFFQIDDTQRQLVDFRLCMRTRNCIKVSLEPNKISYLHTSS